ncbi:MAG: fibronectin type III domain-containing protein [Thermodesulfovibrionales bacterium]
MKKIIVIVMSVMLVAFALVAGCGGGGGTATVSGSTPVTISLGLAAPVPRAEAAAKVARDIPLDVVSLRVTVTAPDMITIIRIIDVSGGSLTSVTLDVPNGLNRHFVVEGLDAAGNVLYRGEVFADLNGTPVPLTVQMISVDSPPNFAGIEGVSSATTNSLTLMWRPGSDNITPPERIQYLIYMSTTPGGQNLSTPSFRPGVGAQPVNGLLTFVIGNLTPGTTYYFKIRAMDERGNVDLNAVEKSGTTLIPGVTPPPPPPPPPPASQFIDFTPSGGSIVAYFDLTFSVVNNGNIPAYNVPIWVLTDPGVVGAGAECEEFNGRNMNPGTPLQFTAFLFFNQNYLIVIDPKNAFAESNESNNVACGGAFCKTPPPLPKQCFVGAAP